MLRFNKNVLTLWIPLKEGIGGEREGEDFMDNSIEKRNSEIAVFRKHVGHVGVYGIPYRSS
jgi:hypothetical protein